MSNTRVADLAQALLTEVVNYYSAQGVGLPARRYVAPGQVALDCDQCVVALSRIFSGVPGRESLDNLKINPGRVAELAVMITRCVPVVTESRTRPVAPTANSLDNAGIISLTDAYMLAQGLHVAWSANAFDGMCHSLTIVRVEPIGPEGGFAGQIMIIQAQV